MSTARVAFNLLGIGSRTYLLLLLRALLKSVYVVDIRLELIAPECDKNSHLIVVSNLANPHFNATHIGRATLVCVYAIGRREIRWRDVT